MILSELARQIMWTIRTRGPMGRRDLAQCLNTRPNTIGDTVTGMIKQGLLCEGQQERAGRGRPLVPLQIDTARRCVLGLAIKPGSVGICRMNLAGRPVGETDRKPVRQPGRMVSAARQLLASHLDRKVLAVGLTATGFVDTQTHQLLLSSSIPAHRPVSLQPLFDEAGNLPVLLDNDMHALAAAWLLTHPGEPADNMMLVELRDGAMGAAILTGGRPQRGCVIGGSEIGHMRTQVATAPCYCGQTGCLERIFSSQFLGSTPGACNDLAHRIAKPRATDTRLRRIIELISDGLANAVNLLRPDRLVLHLSFEHHHWLFDQLAKHTRQRMLAPLAGRIGIDDWQDAPSRFAQSAGWLALAGLYAACWN